MRGLRSKYPAVSNNEHDEIKFHNKPLKITNLETGRAPVDELDSSLCLDTRNGGLSVLGGDITTVQQSTSHLKEVYCERHIRWKWHKWQTLTVFALTRVALYHLAARFEARESHLRHRVLLVMSFVC